MVHLNICRQGASYFQFRNSVFFFSDFNFKAQFSVGLALSVRHVVVELGNVSTGIHHPQTEDSKYPYH